MPTVVITDIDPVRETQTAGGKATWIAAPIIDPDMLKSANDSLTKWHPGFSSLKDYAQVTDKQKVWTSAKGGRVRFAWQVPVPSDGPWPSSFEDSLILNNIEWFRAQADATGPLGRTAREVTKHSDLAHLNEALHGMLRDSFKKGDFAATIFEHLSLGAPIQCPSYIFDALTWLDSELKPVSPGEHQ